MKALRIRGGRPLNGEIDVSGAKNAALPMMCAALLSDKPITLRCMPDLQDIRSLERLLGLLGVAIHETEDETGRVFQAVAVPPDPVAPYELVRTMRASVLVLGPLLARMGRARVSLPGGCAIGARPIDQHLKGLEALGADISVAGGYVEARCDRLRGGRVTFDMPTVGGTENILMAAALADGETVIENAAREPEITALADLLSAMGIDISGAGTATIHVQGAQTFVPADQAVPGDRIEAGTYLLAAAATRGNIVLRNIQPQTLDAALTKLDAVGCSIETGVTSITLGADAELQAQAIRTAPFPGFPTDLQAQWMALMCTTDGTAEIIETIFENRYMHVPELLRMGADIRVSGNTAIVHGGKPLTGAPVMATDLRASAGLVIAGLAAHGTTDVLRIYHLQRGYAQLERKLRRLGADVEVFDRDATVPHIES